MFRKERKPAYVKTFVAFLLLPLIVVAAFLFFKPLSSLGQASYTISVSNAGGGSVASSPSGISCGVDCSEPYAYGTNVVLTASPSASFTGWTNCPAPSGNTCTINVNGNLAVTATFSALYTISVANAGGGSVISNPPGISCGAGGTDCSESYPYGRNVRLNPAPVFGYGFTGWTNCPAVSNNDVCIIDVNGNLAVTATFSAFYTISVTNAGGGSVISSPVGISCGAGGTDCSEPYAYGTNVVLTAAPVFGYTFTGWNGTCPGTTNPCNLTVNANVNTQANFAVVTYPLNITVSGSGTTLCSVNNGAYGPCPASVTGGSSVRIQATPSANFVFTGWNGTCPGTTNPCNLTVNANVNTQANFAAVLTVIKSPPIGAGTITGGGINCGAGAGCTASYTLGSNVVLTAAANLGYVLHGWIVSGPTAGAGCAGNTGTCTIRMTAPGTVTATFKLILNVARLPANRGAITSNPPPNPPGISCGTDCSESYSVNANVILTATPVLNFTLSRWLVSGPTAGADCAGVTGTCTVRMTAPGLVTAYFVSKFSPIDGWAGGWSTDSAGTNPYIDTNPAGPGRIALINTTSTPRDSGGGVMVSSPQNYGLTFYLEDAQTNTGFLEGYIWSSSFGWIEFRNTGAWCYPGKSPCGATVDSLGNVHGWARIVSLEQAGGSAIGLGGEGDGAHVGKAWIKVAHAQNNSCGNAGGWSPNDCYRGWIKLGSEVGDPVSYGLNIKNAPGAVDDGALSGYAWSNEFGWFRFAGSMERVRVGSNTAFCNLDATQPPPVPKVVGVVPSAQTSLTWSCRYTDDDCRLSASTDAPPYVPPIVRTSTNLMVGPTTKTFTQDTAYTISCTGAPGTPQAGNQVSDSDTVTLNVQQPSTQPRIIECNPGSPNCK
ncbi:MAG: hypothetical protein A3B25_00775 [Candidatus Ryanbacteria bacterium RIFCSPLOWO2_01_FULL_48_26]|uniref:Bacterial repeat domain-containing protein n=1 Tax=Candidatus Ryanbacteria bacterium RIFCSPLOWO2_01_FULL_48_26 TaxID=1802126 RepID=A0A1G2GT38_9BACT|nr:MAG: hypothetical protein A3B25_00775 [Candidatus Ryanbacteria bacterium RIFCSPLOWO2_01_FULL_48_26]